MDTASELGTSGHVVDAIPLALFVASAIRDASVEAVIRAAISSGGDTDTRASIAAQVVAAAGAIVPSELLGRIRGIEDIRAAVDEFAAIL